MKKWKRNWDASTVSGANEFKDPNGIVKMDFSASSAAAQSTFLKCYDNKIKGKVASSNTAYSDSYKKAMDMFAKEGGAFFTQIEKTYKCAGLCEKGLFYVTKPVSEGRPEKSCVAAF